MFIYSNIKFQKIIGMGGCFNEIGAEALKALSKEEENKVLQALFGNKYGDGFTYCRTPIGASDFAFDAYSYDDIPNDYEMKHFSIKRDESCLIPYIKKALKTNPNIKLFASPWSPPAWMKESGYMDKGIEFPDRNGIIDKSEVYKAYAIYLSKYASSYKKNGINIDRILVQNEQDSRAKFPSCRLLCDKMSNFVEKYMRPQFKKDRVKTEIWGGTFRTAQEADGLRFAATKKYRDNFDGMGIQYTFPQYIRDIKTLAPDMKLMHTEGACFNGENSREQASTRFEEVANYLNGGCENFCYWNMILNETGKSGWDWRQNSLITIDRSTKQITYNPDYAVMKLLTCFIKPGSVRIGSFSRSSLISTEYNNSYYLVMQNNLDKPLTYNCDINGEIVIFEIPAQSLCGVEITK